MKTIWLSFMLLITIHAATAQPVNPFEKEWKEVAKFEREGLYKSAMEKVDFITENAAKQKIYPSAIKGILFKMKYSSWMEEDDFIKSIALLKKLNTGTMAPYKQMLHSVTAQVYYEYFQQNSWRMYSRTHTDDMKQEDIRTWDIKTISFAIRTEYMLSLSDENALKTTKLSDYDEILLPDKADFTIRPTLYDLLVERAIQFYRSNMYYFYDPADQRKLTNKALLGDTKTFVAQKIETNDSTSRLILAAKLYTEWAKFHLNDKDQTVMLDIDLLRLQFIRDNISLPNNQADSLFHLQLKSLLNTHKSTALSARVAYELAKYMDTEANKYNYQDENTFKFRMKRKEAIDLLNQYATRYPKDMWGENCRILALKLAEPFMRMDQELFIRPGQKSRQILTYKNASTLYFRAYKLPDTYFIDQPWKALGPNKYIVDELLTRKVDKAWTKTVKGGEDYQQHTTEIVMDGLEHGFYIIMVSPKALPGPKDMLSWSKVYVTNLSMVHRQLKNQQEFVALNQFTGQSLSNTKITFYKIQYNNDRNKRSSELVEVSKGNTNEKGRFTEHKILDHQSLYVRLTNPALHEDILLPNTVYFYKDYEQPEDLRMYFFTDRAIYRPGQTIYFKGILGQPTGNGKRKATPGKDVKVEIKDPNGEVVGTLNLKTNEFGSLEGSFSAPFGRLNGQYHLSCAYGQHWFSVEEYKRPRFEVQAEPVKSTYKLGDEVKVTGLAKGYAGNAVDGATVKYWITRNSSIPWWSYRKFSYYPTAKEIASGEVVTDGQGRYTIPVTLNPDSTLAKELTPTFYYNVRVEVTDITGETRGTSYSFTAAYHTLSIWIPISGRLFIPEKDKYEKIYVSNLAGSKANATGRITIHKLEYPTVPVRSQYWNATEYYELSSDEHKQLFPFDVVTDPVNQQTVKEGPAVLTYEINTRNADSIKLELSKLTPGKYRMKIDALDSLNIPTQHRQDFDLFAPSDGQVATNEWLSVVNKKYSYQVGETAEILLASSHQVQVHMDIEKNGKIIRSETIDLNKQQKLLKIPITEELEGNATMHFLCLSEGRNHSNTQTLDVKFQKTELKVEFETFRNKMLPGSKEEWRIKISGPDKDAVAAELMATMYDASLDAFRGNYFSFSPHDRSYSRTYWRADANSRSQGTQQSGPSEPRKFETNYRYPYLNWFGLYYNRYETGGSGPGGSYYWDGDEFGAVEEAYYDDNKPAPSPSVATGATAKKSETRNGGGLAERQVNTIAQEITVDELEASGEADKSLGAVQARSNLNETAFFFPQLKTDKQGNVIMSFTMPESVTKWKFMALAHTADFKFGSLYEEAVTQKDVMVQPNFPRFLREGDKMEFSAKVSNMTDKEISGTAKLILLDAHTMTPIDGLFENNKSDRQFTAAAGGSAPLKWIIKIPDGQGAVIAKVVAQSGKHTDGEEMALPILTNKVLITETMPLTVRKKGKTEFTFKRFEENNSSTLTHHRYTIEFSANPAWYAVQALPYMIEYPHECNEQIFTRMYGNALAAYVVAQNPSIAKVYERWKQQGGSALMSNLEKNQELKSLMLEETPWVMDARDEGERKKRVALLMDVNKMSAELGSALKKLKDGQMEGGAWPWFSGMQPNRYITQHIVTGLGHLRKLGVLEGKLAEETKDMTSRAISWLDYEIKRDFDYIKATHPNYANNQHLSHLHIQYLYMRSFFPEIKVPSETKTAFDYFSKQAETYWLEFPLQTEAMIGVIAHRYGKKDLVSKIAASHKERAIRNDEMGVYWKELIASYWWYQAPIESQAMLIEFFMESGQEQAWVDDMRLWLLRQKQTTDWKTTRATAMATYALLVGQQGKFLQDSELPEIVVGKEKIVYNKDVEPEAGTGYVKKSWTGGDIKKGMANVTITRKQDGISWGSLYWQYFEVPDKVTSAGAGLKVEKKMYLLKRSAKDNEAIALGDNVKLKPGDRIRHRLIVTADRDYEFVHMKDMRAAGTEPLQVFSGYRWGDGLGYYQSTRDAATHFFFDWMPKGTYVIEYDLKVELNGDFSNGLATIQSMYAPEFAGHSNGSRLSVGE